MSQSPGFSRYSLEPLYDYTTGESLISNKIFRDLGVSGLFNLHIREVFCKTNGVASNILHL